MKRKDGNRKLKAIRQSPVFQYGFKDNPANIAFRQVHQRPDVRKKQIQALSLFSGCGGFDFGLLGGFKVLGKSYEPLPFNLVKSYDFDALSVETYRLNISDDIECVDLTTLPPASMPPCDVLFGGFPCQDFASCGPKQGLEGKRGRLYEVLIDYMKEHRPPVVVAENVPHLEKMHGGLVLQTILEEMSAVGYRFKVWRVPCADYGLPQRRVRLFLVGVRDDIKQDPLPPPPQIFHHVVTIDEALKDLEDVEGEAVTNQGQYFVATKATAGAGQGDEVSRRGEPAYTVRANSKARVQFHYSLERRLTVRESARLQSFPDEFVFPHATGHNMMQIGNAVPPIIGHLVGEAITDFCMKVLYNIHEYKVAA